MAWLVHDILINFFMSMWKLLTLLVIFFGKMADFINFKAVQDDVDDDAIVKVDECESARTVKDNEFRDNEW